METPEILTSNIETIKENLPKYSVLEKERLLLKVIERRTNFPGQSIGLKSEIDYPLVWAKNKEELAYLLNSLEDRELIKQHSGGPNSVHRITIQPKGWEYVDSIEKIPLIQRQVFVAMSFSKELKRVWKEGIEPAVRDAGYDPYRIDERPHIDRIDAKIMTEIRNSRFLIADVTEQKAGVYFEAGFALGLNRPVIWSVFRPGHECRRLLPERGQRT